MPECFNVTLVTPEGERAIRVGSDQHIWEAAAAAGIKLPAMCHIGHCLTCAGRVEGAGEFDQSDARQYLPEDRAAGYILLCAAKPRSDLRIRTHQQRASEASVWRRVCPHPTRAFELISN